MAIAEKSNGDIRICIDPQALNEALPREHFCLLFLDDVLVQLNGARIFSKLDVKDAFWHVKLDHNSSLLTTMITPFGRFRWLRFPFRLKVSSEIFQRKLGETLEGLCNTINVADDIVLTRCGKTDARLKLTSNHALKN
ncbi:polyprotein [Elysia marginata]|uniref:Polyprotein n=1 Tax=Elysia marginata TaxID=1093978 RepID=A0AAV4HG56_9GAST|nr:polyprotein [Elysia marginata]